MFVCETNGRQDEEHAKSREFSAEAIPLASSSGVSTSRIIVGWIAIESRFSCSECNAAWKEIVQDVIWRNSTKDATPATRSKSRSHPLLRLSLKRRRRAGNCSFTDGWVPLRKCTATPQTVFFFLYNPGYLFFPLPAPVVLPIPSYESRNSFSTSALMIYAFGWVLCISAQCVRLQLF